MAHKISERLARNQVSSHTNADGMRTALDACMSNTNILPVLSTIDNTALTDVTGGCRSRRCRCSNSSVVVVNNNQPAPPRPQFAMSSSVGVSY